MVEEAPRFGIVAPNAERFGNPRDVAEVSRVAEEAGCPRIPIWVGGDSAPALRRAARWDGWIGPTEPWKDTWTPEDLVSFRERIEKERDSSQPLEIAWNGSSTPEDGDMVEAYRQAGAHLVGRTHRLVPG